MLNMQYCMLNMYKVSPIAFEIIELNCEGEVKQLLIALSSLVLHLHAVFYCILLLRPTLQNTIW